MTDDRARFAQRLGAVLNGKWTLESLLGSGGMAAVYAARHRIGTEVAIKMLHPEVARSKELTLRFEQEARVMAQLKHPGAVAVSDVDVTEDGQPFIVMELLSGEPLGERLRRDEDLPLADVLRWMAETLDVLGAAHAQGIVHRDIKLDNLFICRDGRVKLLDFGIARVRDAFPLTMVGTRLGTLPYMPPEQVRGQAVDGRVDVFAAGAVMFRLLAKRRIHEASTEPELLIKMSSEPAPPLGSVAPSVPAPVQLVVDRALAFDRDRRYPEARIMQEDIQAVRRGEPPPFATRRLALDGPPNPTAAGAAASARPVSRTMATRAASPVALPRGGATSEATAATALAAAAAGLASEPTAAAASGAVGAGAVLVNAPLSALVEPSPSTVDATPFEATAAPAAPAPPSAPVPGTARLPSAAAQLAAHTLISPGSAPVAELTLVSSGQAALGGSSPVASAPDIAVESAAPARSAVVAGPAASAGAPKERRLPAGVLLSMAGAGLLVLVIAIFLLWPSAEPAASEDTTREAAETAQQEPVSPPPREAAAQLEDVAATPVPTTQVVSDKQAVSDKQLASDKQAVGAKPGPADSPAAPAAAPKSPAPAPSPAERSEPPPAERPERAGPPPHARGKGRGRDRDTKRKDDD